LPPIEKQEIANKTSVKPGRPIVSPLPEDLITAASDPKSPPKPLMGHFFSVLCILAKKNWICSKTIQLHLFYRNIIALTIEKYAFFCFYQKNKGI